MLKHFHAWCHLTAQVGLWNVCALGLEPFRVVESYLAPSFHFQACIIFLAIIFVVGTDRTVGCYLPPLVVRLQTLRRAVLILHNDVDATFGIAKGMNLVGLVLLHGEQTTIA